MIIVCHYERGENEILEAEFCFAFFIKNRVAIGYYSFNEYLLCISTIYYVLKCLLTVFIIFLV